MIEKTKKFFRGIKVEIKKIVWPTAKKTALSSGGAVAFMVALSAVLFGFDHVAGALVRCVLALF